jgi:L-asparagine oxygenase
MYRTLGQNGFSLHKKLIPHFSTIEAARGLGSIVDVDSLLPSSGIPTVQSLKPRETTEGKPNQYSGHFGLGQFPLHTDLAHWMLPPRYLLLRCVVGADSVFTNILPWAFIVELIGRAELKKSVFRARRRRPSHSGLVRALSQHDQGEVFRWDSVFLEPLNRHAQALKRVMLDPLLNAAMIEILLREPGDTLVIDNWRMLHGRGQISPLGKVRHIERVYLSEVF